MLYTVAITIGDPEFEIEADSEEEAMDMAIDTFVDNHGLSHNCCQAELTQDDRNYEVIVTDCQGEQYTYYVYGENEEQAKAEALDLYGVDDVDKVTIKKIQS